MADPVALIVAVVILFLVFRWVLGSNANPSSGPGSTRGPTAPRRRTVTPDMVESVKNMFPEVSTAAIQADLALTGSVEATCDKILAQGGLPIPAQFLPRDAQRSNSDSNRVVSDSPGQNSVSPPSPTSSSGSDASLFTRYQLSEKSEVNEPAKVWTVDPEQRQQTLLQRKQFMVQQARKKMLEKQQAKQESEQEQSQSTNQN